MLANADVARGALVAAAWHAYCLVTQLKVGGLLGGHSGIDIATGRGNAVQLLAHALRKARDAAGGRIWLAAAAAGDKRNAIAREGAAAVLLAEADAPAARQAVASCLEHFIAEYGTLEKVPTHAFSRSLARFSTQRARSAGA